MKLTFISAHQRVGPLRKAFEADGSVRSYPPASKLTSHEVEFDHKKRGLEQYRQLLLDHGAMGRALYTGHFKEPLNNDSRRGKTDKDAKTSFAVLDVDDMPIKFDKSKCSREDVAAAAEGIIKLLPEHLHDVSYVAVASSSFGMKTDEMSIHLHFLLEDAVEHRDLKDWLVGLNYLCPEISEKLELTPSKARVGSIIDPCLGEASRLVYIAPPDFAEGVDDPFRKPEDRIVHVKKAKPLLSMDAEMAKLSKASEIVRDLKAQKLKSLQKAAGVDTRRKDKMVRMMVAGRSMTVLANPIPCRMTYAYESDEFVRYNMAGKKNNAYWVYKDNPEVVYSFKPEEPNMLFRVADVEAYSIHVEKWGKGYQEEKDKETGEVRRVSREMYIDQNTDQYVTIEYDEERDELVEMLVRRGAQTASEWMKEHGRLVPDPVPSLYVVVDPDEPRCMYNIGNKRYLNRFRATGYLKGLDLPDVPELYLDYGTAFLMHENVPIITQVILNMLGDDLASYEHFINWLAHIVQSRNKAETAWLLGGTEGTGKGLLFKAVLREIFGPYAMQTQLQNIADDQFNDWMEDKLLVMVDEFNMKGAGSSQTKSASQLKQLITEPTFNKRAMQQSVKETVQRLNFIFTTNDLDALSINDKRRFNISPRQLRDLKARIEGINRFRKEYDAMIKEEVPYFAAYLRAFRVNENATRNVLESKARTEIIQAGMNVVDRFFSALEIGDYGSFIDILDKSSFSLAPDEQGPLVRAKKLLIDSLAHVNTGRPCYYLKDDLCDLYSYLANKPISKNQFGRMLSGHELPKKRVMRPVGHTTDLQTRPECIEITWEYADLDILENVKTQHTPRATNVADIRKGGEEKSIDQILAEAAAVQQLNGSH